MQVSVGQVFGRLTVTGDAGRNGRGERMVSCVCSCGNTKDVIRYSLTSGGTRSCGCLLRETAAKKSTTHGLSKRPEYGVWLAMVSRCHNARDVAFGRYGGRGITVCDRWRSSLENFISDMGNRPPDMDIDRIDNNGNYEPGNCRWVTHKENCRNTRRNRIVTAFGESKPLAAWGDDPRCVVPWSALKWRIDNGWDVERAMTTPSSCPRHPTPSPGI